MALFLCKERQYLVTIQKVICFFLVPNKKETKEVGIGEALY